MQLPYPAVCDCPKSFHSRLFDSCRQTVARQATAYLHRNQAPSARGSACGEHLFRQRWGERSLRETSPTREGPIAKGGGRIQDREWDQKRNVSGLWSSARFRPVNYPSLARLTSTANGGPVGASNLPNA